VLFADAERLERLVPHLADTPVATVVGVRTGQHAEPAGTVPWDDLVADDGGDGAGLPAVDLGPDDDATIMYTSGTTGRPKGAVGTHRNVTSHLMNAMYAATEGATAGAAAPGPPVTLLTFPLFHVGGFHSFLLPYTVAGGTVVLLYRWDAAKALDLVEREGVTTVFTEALVAPDVADALAREAGVRTAVLNPLEGLTQEQVERGADYFSVMRENLAALREALSCA
jgi:long-chain acyl-CoA synthetase